MKHALWGSAMRPSSHVHSLVTTNSQSSLLYTCMLIELPTEPGPHIATPQLSVMNAGI